MIVFRDSEFWHGLQIEPDAFIIDLHGCKTKYDFIGTLTDTLHGKGKLSTPYPERPPFSNLDGMNDYVGDFFSEAWGKKTKIYILGWQHLLDFDPLLACNITSTLDSAFLRAVYDQCLNHDGVGVLEEVNGNVRIIAILN